MADPIDPRIRRSRKLLGNPYAYLDDKGGFDAIFPDTYQTDRERLKAYQNPYAFAPGNDALDEFGMADRPIRVRPVIDTNLVFQVRKKGGRLSRQDIENIARTLQRELWSRRSEFFPDRTFASPLEILEPSLAFGALGYQYDTDTSIGQHSQDGVTFEVAGLIDPSRKRVQLSRQFLPAIRNFTAAHELGHAILHDNLGLHRDRPLDGSAVPGTRDQTELEADIFAACFLMPSKQVRKSFNQIFQTEQFELTERTAFALNAGDYETIRARCRTIRDLSRILASTKQYDGANIVSLAELYGVSVEAMAIRLEELNLHRF